MAKHSHFESVNLIIAFPSDRSLWPFDRRRVWRDDVAPSGIAERRLRIRHFAVQSAQNRERAASNVVVLGLLPPLHLDDLDVDAEGECLEIVHVVPTQELLANFAGVLHVEPLGVLHLVVRLQALDLVLYLKGHGERE